MAKNERYTLWFGVMIVLVDINVSGSKESSLVASKKKTVKIGRDARTGKFIPVKQAEKRPATTVAETIGRPKRKR